MKDYNLQLKVRNNYLLTAMRKRGLETASDLARASGARPGDVGALLNLKMGAYTRQGTVRASVERVCNALGLYPEDIFPPQHLENPLKRNVSEAEISVSEAQMLSRAVDPAQMLEVNDISREISNMMDGLSEREQQVIHGRFWKDQTLRGVAEDLGISTERVRQVEAKALRKMRHPTRTQGVIDAGAYPNQGP